MIADKDLTSRTLFKLIVLHNFITRPFVVEIGKKYNLSITEWRVLFIIGARPGISSAEMIEAFGFEKMSLSRSVSKLIANGRAEMFKDPEDRRKGCLKLTESGRDFLREVTPTAIRRDAVLDECLSGDERLVLDDMLTRLIEALRK